MIDSPPSGEVLGISTQLSSVFTRIGMRFGPSAILDILLVALILFWIYAFLKETRAMRILYGIVFLALLFFLARALNLTAINYILRYVLTIVAVAIPVVFQPELRNALEKLGRSKLIGVSSFSKLKVSERAQFLQTLSQTVQILARNKVGALLVIGQKSGLKEFIQSGVLVNATLSKEILLNIFAPNTPLHDGAVIILGNKIAAAACTLPLSEGEYDYKIGTRHRAAIGLTSQTDALVVVVSEETGNISISSDGVLRQDLAPNELVSELESLIAEKKENSKKITNNSDAPVGVRH